MSLTQKLFDVYQETQHALEVLEKCEQNLRDYADALHKQSADDVKAARKHAEILYLIERCQKAQCGVRDWHY